MLCSPLLQVFLQLPRQPHADLARVACDQFDAHVDEIDAGRVARRSGGSAHQLQLTPSAETYHAAESGKLQLVQLTHRYGGRPLPASISSTCAPKLAAGNPREVSVRLARELQENLDNGEQSILLLNRRGYRTIGMCTTCGHVLKCPNCSVPLVYHKPQQALMCHHCGHTVHPLPQTCPECGGKISYSGFGTQRVEEELAELLPSARILRMDQDSTSARTRTRRCLHSLRGTNMIFCWAPRWSPRALTLKRSRSSAF